MSTTEALQVEVVTLSPAERSQLHDCEIVIEEGRDGFLRAGHALARIREGRLYRETHGSFEAYCQDRWKLSKTHVNRQIQAAKAIEAIGDARVAPTTEAQMRPLAGLPAVQQQAAWERATNMAQEQGKAEPTGPIVRQAVQVETNTLRPPPPVRKYVLVDDLIEEFKVWAAQRHMAPGFIRSTVAWLKSKGGMV